MNPTKANAVPTNTWLISKPLPIPHIFVETNIIPRRAMFTQNIRKEPMAAATIPLLLEVFVKMIVAATRTRRIATMTKDEHSVVIWIPTVEFLPCPRCVKYAVSMKV